ncbi:hypothetical protein [Actinoplanes sp. NPDC026670]|uniref:hypothetical protein n=1 Tax=Actinoplanes sp. NPDC026670 TaxID=3154700 RepID=UPI0033DDB640
MTGESDGIIRRAFSTLAFCYAMIWCLPVALAKMMNDSDPPGSTPGYSYVNGRRESCKGDFGCPSEPADLGGVFQSTGVALIPSLLVAVPLCAYLARKWQMPVFAGIVAAVTGWITICAARLLFLGA